MHWRKAQSVAGEMNICASWETESEEKKTLKFPSFHWRKLIAFYYLDQQVQAYLMKLREVGGVVNSAIARRSSKGKIRMTNP